MKIIEAMKKIKDLQRKVSDIKTKINEYCVDFDFQDPVYGTVDKQTAQIKKWTQSCEDIIKQILNLRESIQRTNVGTQVEIAIGDKLVTHSIAGWIHRRRDLAQLSASIYKTLNENKIQVAGVAKDKDGKEIALKRRVFFDPKTRDEKIELYTSEPAYIDSKLETVNAVTDLI